MGIIDPPPLLRAANLSDLASASTARANLGLSGSATASLPLSAANGGTGQTTATAALAALGGQPLALPLTAVSASGNITSTFQLYLVSAASGNITLTLPSPSAQTGVPFFLKRTDNSTNYVTVNPNSSELIDNGLHAYMANSDAALILISDGTNWWSL